MIEIDNVTIALRGRTVLHNCSARLRADTVTHLVGPNGSGKTSLIRALAGIQRYSGSIRFDGASVARVRPRLYVCFDDAPLLPYLTGYENVGMLLGHSLGKRALAAIAPSVADDALLRVRARKLSHGQRKRVHVLAALASGASYLIFDEALNGVDPETVEAISDALDRRPEGQTVLFTGHHEKAYAHLGARRMEIVDGRIVSPDERANGIPA